MGPGRADFGGGVNAPAWEAGRELSSKGPVRRHSWRGLCASTSGRRPTGTSRAGPPVPTVPAVQKLREIHGAAGGPGQRLVQVDEQRCHHVVLAHGPEEPRAGLGVVVGHAEDVPWGERPGPLRPVLPEGAPPGPARDRDGAPQGSSHPLTLRRSLRRAFPCALLFQDAFSDD